MKALALWIFLAIPSLTFATTKIGIVVPDDPSLSWLSKPFEIGAELAYKKLTQSHSDFTFEIVHLPHSGSEDAKINALTDAITEKKIDAIVAASTPDTAHALRHLHSQWTTPTVIVTPDDPVASLDLEDRNGYIIDLGVPLQFVHREVVKRWRNCYAGGGLAILYNKNFSWATKFAEQTAEGFTQNPPTTLLGWSDSESARFREETLKKLAQTVAANDNVGVIMAGAPWNTDQWVSFLARTGVKPPIYLGPLVSGLSELKRLASKTDSAIFAASQYWTNPADSSQMDFTVAATQELGWSQKVPSAPLALQAYDAIAFIVSAAPQGRIGSSPGTGWWQNLPPIQGIKGPLQQYNDTAVWAPPIDLLRVENDGTVSFSDNSDRCPQ